jgi:DNA-binding transcriptional LysR family regulator
MLEQLAAGQLDMVMAPQPRRFHDARLDSHVMYISQHAICCREKNPMANAATLKQVARAQWVVAGSAGAPGNVIEEAFRVRRWVTPRIAAHCSDYAMLVQLVSRSDLLGVVTHEALVPDPLRQGIAQLRLREGLPHYEVRLFWHASGTLAGHPLVNAVLPAMTAA